MSLAPPITWSATAVVRMEGREQRVQLKVEALGEAVARAELVQLARVQYSGAQSIHLEHVCPEL